MGREAEEARCGEADVSAQSLVGALLGSCVDKPTIAPGKPARGFGETTLGGLALQDLAPELLLPPHYAVPLADLRDCKVRWDRAQAVSQF